MNSIIIDTHIFLWLMEGSSDLKESEIELINKVIHNGQILVPSISIWEIAMLQKLGKITLSMPIKYWIEQSLNQKGIVIAAFDTEILIESVFLPGNFHKDPADRMIVATSRIKKVPLLTHDQRIIDYSNEGYLQIIEL
ncbi:MAG: type II toxin-antitoxin system VapC family toxin [Gammaproteobacteria bacterium]